MSADQGSVLIYMAEDAAPAVKARLAGICRARGIDLAGADIQVITAPALRLDRGRDQARLRDAVRRHAPRLLILDPFVRVHRIDENDAKAVSAVLGYLRTLQRQHDTAVLVVHHARKNGSGAQTGLSLRGSGDFFAWADSLLHMRRQKNGLLLTIEHRAAAAPDPLSLQLVANDDTTVHLALATGAAGADDEDPARALDRRIVDALRTAAHPLGRSQLRDQLRVRNERLGDALLRLAAAGAVVRDADRWSVPVPLP